MYQRQFFFFLRIFVEALQRSTLDIPFARRAGVLMHVPPTSLAPFNGCCSSPGEKPTTGQNRETDRRVATRMDRRRGAKRLADGHTIVAAVMAGSEGWRG